MRLTKSILNFIKYIMELIKYKEILYGKFNSELFIWDSVWETFRPIKKIGWNGSIITHIDYKDDLFNEWYGFGSSEMKEKCKHLTENTDLGTYSTDITKLFLDKEWFFDRYISFLPCSSKDNKSWSKYLNSSNLRHKTLRNSVQNKTRKSKLIS